MKVIIKKSIFTIIILFIIFAILEVMARLFIPFIYDDNQVYKIYSDFFPQHAMYIEDKYLFWKGNPNWKGKWCDIQVELNSYGLRDNEFDLKKNKNTYRILSLGESSTFGSKVALEKTYNKYLEKLLNKYKNNKKITYQVINAGQLSHSSFQGYLYLKKYGLKFEPDMIMTYFECNDHLPSYFVQNSTQCSFMDLSDYMKVGSGITDRELFKRRQKLYKVIKVLNKSRLYRFISKLVQDTKTLLSSDTVGKNQDRFQRVPEKDRKWVFSKYVAIANKHNVKLLVLIPAYVPYIWRKEGYNPFSWLETSDNVYILDLGKIFKNSQYKKSELFADDIHPTELGNKIIGDAIFSFISTKMFKDRDY